MIITLVSSNSSAHNTFKQNTHHTKKKEKKTKNKKQTVANTGVPQHEHF
jgi:hypothetical protein